MARTVRRGDYMVVNDLVGRCWLAWVTFLSSVYPFRVGRVFTPQDSGYWHVPIAAEHQKYLGVHHVAEDGGVTYWVWRVLCLGLRDAAHLFTRIIRPIMGELRRRGVRGIIYIDDKLTVDSTFEACLASEEEVVRVFSSCGWVFKACKRSGDPSQCVRFLGLMVDSRDMTFAIPEDKLVRIIEDCGSLLRGKWVKVRKVASVVGLIQFVRRATGPIVGVMTRSLNHAVQSAYRWESWVRLDELARFELQWWRSNVRGVSKYPISGKLSTTVVAEEVASDGSALGHFCYSVGGGVRLAGRPFNAWEQAQSSTYRELLAFKETWTSEEVLARFEGKRVAHLTDSKAMCYIIERGSRNRRLQPMVVEATLALRGWGIHMEALWRSRDEGVIRVADLGSRDYHHDDISFDFQTFSMVVERFGEFDVDCFAASHNKKAVRFFSRLEVLGSAGTDFFLQSLHQGDNHWVFPPPGKLCEAALHLEEQGVAGVMVVPVWPSSSFFSFFWPDGRHCAGWVVDMMLVRPAYVCGPHVKLGAFRARGSFFTAVLKVDFVRYSGEGFHVARCCRHLCLKGGCVGCC